MNYKEEIEVLGKDKFKSFWEALNYLLMAGYTSMDAFGISLLLFDEKRIWDDVAFIRVEGYVHESTETIMAVDPIDAFNGMYRQPEPTVTHVTKEEDLVRIVIGLLDDNTRQLWRVYDIYRKAVATDDKYDLDGEELEKKISVIVLSKLEDLYIQLIGVMSKDYYGYDILEKQFERENNKRSEKKKMTTMQREAMGRQMDMPRRLNGRALR
jgi:hypothetical protein